MLGRARVGRHDQRGEILLTGRRQITRYEQAKPLNWSGSGVSSLRTVSPGLAIMVAVFLIGTLVGALLAVAFLLVVFLFGVAGFAFLCARRRLLRYSASKLRPYRDE